MHWRNCANIRSYSFLINFSKALRLLLFELLSFFIVFLSSTYFFLSSLLLHAFILSMLIIILCILKIKIKIKNYVHIRCNLLWVTNKMGSTLHLVIGLLSVSLKVHYLLLLLLRILLNLLSNLVMHAQTYFTMHQDLSCSFQH